ncbi:oligosaccharide flippase family protein [Parafilimonas sp.]|uniref:oligosaccharide flippase family protein n=1 Tax=Parafilimonas sp. TaxID=1969739 RepID=UPI003F817076
MSFRKLFFKNILITGGYSYLSQIISFFASFITSRLLLPSDFGLVGLITVFSGFITVFSDSGISMAIIRSDYRDTFYRGLNAVSIATGLLLCIITLLLIYPISLFYNSSQLILPGIAIAFLFIFRSLSIVPLAVLQKQLQFAFIGKTVFYSTVVATLSTICLAYVGFTYWSLIWSQYVNIFIVIGLVYHKTNIKISLIKKPVLFKSFYLARKLIGSLMGFNAVNYWARNTDNLIVGKFYGTNELGVYNRAYLMLQLPLNLVTGLFNSVLFPSLVKFKKEGGDVQQEYYIILKVISIIAFPIALILILFPKGFVSILWGNNWNEVSQLLPYFGLLILTQTLLSTVGSIMVMEKMERLLMFAGWLSSGFIIAGIIYGATISLTAIAAFYALAFICLTLPLYILYVFKYKMKFKSGFLIFWLSKLILSIVIWIGIYNSLAYMLFGGLIFWLLIIIIETRPELTKLMQHLKVLYLNRKFKTGT